MSTDFLHVLSKTLKYDKAVAFTRRPYGHTPLLPRKGEDDINSVPLKGMRYRSLLVVFPIVWSPLCCTLWAGKRGSSLMVYLSLRLLFLYCWWFRFASFYFYWHARVYRKLSSGWNHSSRSRSSHTPSWRRNQPQLPTSATGLSTSSILTRLCDDMGEGKG